MIITVLKTIKSEILENWFDAVIIKMFIKCLSISRVHFYISRGIFYIFRGIWYIKFLYKFLYKFLQKYSRFCKLASKDLG